MKIYTETHDIKTYYGEQCKALVFFLDTGLTGDPEKDIVNTAIELKEDLGINNPDDVLNFLIPVITQLVYNAYGDPVEHQYKKPIKSIKETNFDTSCVNGVKGCKLK